MALLLLALTPLLLTPLAPPRLPPSLPPRTLCNGPVLLLQGDRATMGQLAERAAAAGRLNVAFLALFLLGRSADCVALLLKAGRLPEAALFARAYLPSRMSEAVKVGGCGDV